MLKDAAIYRHLGREEFDYRLLASALHDLGYRAPTKKISDLIRNGVLTSVKKGLYIFSEDYSREPVRRETLANMIYGPSCISLEYALAHHGLIPERVDSITSVTPKRDKIFETPLGRFTYRHLSMAKYPEGMELVWLDSKHPVLIASPEKAIADYIYLNKIKTLKSEREAREFLIDDLRIAPENWPKLNALKLHQLNRHYRNKNLAKVSEALEESRL